MSYGQGMQIMMDKVEILQLQHMSVIFLAKVDKSHKVSHFHKMTKKKRCNGHLTHVSHSGIFGARQTLMDTICTTSI